MVTTPLLEATDLYRFYHASNDETLALRGVSLRVDRGELVAITGPSGSGKSTLLACLAGLDEPDGGMVYCGGEPVSRRPESERASIRARHIGTLFQTGNLIGHLSIEQNVVMAQQLAGTVDRDAIRGLLEQLGLASRSMAAPNELSGGEATRAGLAVALANDPDVLLADEPTGELDGASARRLMDLLHEVASNGTAVLVVTHNSVVASQAGREIRMADGRILDEGQW